MLVELFDERLADVITEEEYLYLKMRAERAYARIQHEAPAAVLADLSELMQVVREIETKLLDDCTDRRNSDWAQGSMATLA